MFMKNITWLLVIFNRKKCYAFFLTYRKPADRFLIDVISILKYLQNILILINPIFIEDQLNFTLNTSLNFVYIMTAQNVLFTIVGMVVSTIPTTYGEIYHKIHMGWTDTHTNEFLYGIWWCGVLALIWVLMNFSFSGYKAMRLFHLELEMKRKRLELELKRVSKDIENGNNPSLDNID